MSNKGDLGLEGFLLVSKPKGISSFRVVKKIRYLTKVKKVGHAGTLDPFATGLLLIAVGRAYTKQIDEFQALDKLYDAKIVFGIETDTLDSYGKVIKTDLLGFDKAMFKQDSLNDIFLKFEGSLLQEPPLFSAKKVNGQRLYKLARKGEKPEVKASRIYIKKITLLDINLFSLPVLRIRVECSKGTYIRSLARDLAYKMGTVAYVQDLDRVKIGHYSVDSAVNYADLTEKTIRENLFKKTGY